MLVLTRRLGEEIVAYDEHGLEITFRVLKIASNQVRVGVQGPRRVQIDRKEVYTRRQNERWAKVNAQLERDNQRMRVISGQACICSTSEFRNGLCQTCGRPE